MSHQIRWEDPIPDTQAAAPCRQPVRRPHPHCRLPTLTSAETVVQGRHSGQILAHICKVIFQLYSVCGLLRLWCKGDIPGKSSLISVK